MSLNRAEQTWPDIDTTNINEDDARLADAIRYAAERELWEPELEMLRRTR
jgi:hypothetical protein